MTTKIQGVYAQGTIKPITKINLPNNYPVQIYIKAPFKKQLSKAKILAASVGILPDLSEDFVENLRKESEVKLSQKWQES